MRRFVLFFAAAAAIPGSPALAAATACPATSADLEQQLDPLTKTSENDMNGLILRTYSGTGLKILGATPTDIRSNWAAGSPVRVDFTLPDVAEKYISSFGSSFEWSCAQDQCGWHPNGSSSRGPGSLLSAGILNGDLGTAVLTCEYE